MLKKILKNVSVLYVDKTLNILKRIANNSQGKRMKNEGAAETLNEMFCNQHTLSKVHGEVWSDVQSQQVCHKTSREVTVCDFNSNEYVTTKVPEAFIFLLLCVCARVVKK